MSRGRTGLLGMSGCVVTMVAGTGASVWYTQVKKNHTPAKQNDTVQLHKGTPQPTGVELLPAPGEFVNCKLKDGEDHLAMPAADCRAKGGTTS